MPELIDETGNKHGRLTVLHRYGVMADGRAAWICQCECGKEVKAGGKQLRNGNIRSCGCLASELTARRNFKHGAATGGKLTPEYRCWCGIVRRCTDPNSAHYDRYGGRGITICKEWIKNFQAFYDHVGDRPTIAHSIDRIEVDGHYEPGNVRWATAEMQANNKSNNVKYDYKGELITLSQAEKFSPVSRKAIIYRISRGWSVSDAIETPGSKVGNRNTRSRA